MNFLFALRTLGYYMSENYESQHEKKRRFLDFI